MKLNETLDNTLNYSKSKSSPNGYYAYFSLLPDSDIGVEVLLIHLRDNKLSVHFTTMGDDIYQIKKKSETFTIFSTISQIVMDHVEEHDIKKIKRYYCKSLLP